MHRRRFEHAGAERIGHEDVSGAPRVHEPGTPSVESAELERIAVAVVEAPENRVDAPQTLDGLEVDAVLTNRQIAALDEREAELLREERVLEIRLVVRPRRQQHDVRRLAVGRRLL